MHIMYMLFIVTIVFILALFLMCIFRPRLKNPIINPLLLCATAIFLFAWTYAMYLHNGNDGFLTFDNISPYICTVIPATAFMNKKTRDFVRPAIAFLGFGMFLAMFISPEFEYLFNYHQNTKLIHVSEAACHLIMGLYGFYLILSDKVKLTMANLTKALTFIYMSIGFVIFLNFMFHRSYFGMNMYGNHSIYFLRIFDTFETTLIAYLLGVFAVMILGFLIGLLLEKISRPLDVKSEIERILAELEKESQNAPEALTITQKENE